MSQLRGSGHSIGHTLGIVTPERQFHSLEDFLASTMSHVDAVLDDG